MKTEGFCEKAFIAEPTSAEAGIECATSNELRDDLEKALRSIIEDIRNYPRPIAGCDQQFNYLLEERDRVSAELGRLASRAR